MRPDSIVIVTCTIVTHCNVTVIIIIISSSSRSSIIIISIMIMIMHSIMIMTVIVASIIIIIPRPQYLASSLTRAFPCASAPLRLCAARRADGWAGGWAHGWVKQINTVEQTNTYTIN